MGSTSSKFKKNLQQGDEYAAMKIYQNSPELRKYLDPNVSYGEHHNHNTALHYAAKHGKSCFWLKNQKIIMILVIPKTNQINVTKILNSITSIVAFNVYLLEFLLPFPAILIF